MAALAVAQAVAPLANVAILLLADEAADAVWFAVFKLTFVAVAVLPGQDATAGLLALQKAPV